MILLEKTKPPKYFNIIVFNDDSTFINVDSIEIIEHHTREAPLFPKFGYIDEFKIKIKINNIFKYLNNTNDFTFKNNGFKSIYFIENTLDSIFKLSNIKNYDENIKISFYDSHEHTWNLNKGDILNIKSLGSTPVSCEITSTIDISTREFVDNDDDKFLIKALLLSHIVEHAA